MDRFDLRFQLDDDLCGRPGASMYGETVCADIPFYGPLITEFTRLGDSEGRMAFSGTFLLRALDPRSDVAQQSPDISLIGRVTIRPTAVQLGSVTVTLAGDGVSKEISIVLVDAVTGGLVAMPTLAPEQSMVPGGLQQLTFRIEPRDEFPDEVDAVLTAGVRLVERWGLQ